MRNDPLRDPGALTAGDRQRVRDYQKSVPGMKIDGRPEHQTVNHMLDEIARLGNEVWAYAILAGAAALVVGSAVTAWALS